MQTCKFCAEEIKDAAVVCKHCGRELAASSTAATPTPAKAWWTSPIWVSALVGVLGVAGPAGVTYVNGRAQVDVQTTRSQLEHERALLDLALDPARDLVYRSAALDYLAGDHTSTKAWAAGEKEKVDRVSKLTADLADASARVAQLEAESVAPSPENPPPGSPQGLADPAPDYSLELENAAADQTRLENELSDARAAAKVVMPVPRRDYPLLVGELAVCGGSLRMESWVDIAEGEIHQSYGNDTGTDIRVELPFTVWTNDIYTEIEIGAGQTKVENLYSISSPVRGNRTLEISCLAVPSSPTVTRTIEQWSPPRFAPATTRNVTNGIDRLLGSRR
jgi:hypothetical protein